MANFIQAFAIGFVVGWFGTVFMMETTDERLQAQKIAIEQCEQHLPRNKYCEPVISAKIVEEKS